MFLAPKNAYRLLSNTDLGWNPIPADTNNNFCHSYKRFWCLSSCFRDFTTKANTLFLLHWLAKY